jgi:uncharacterized OB-fold protein
MIFYAMHCKNCGYIFISFFVHCLNCQSNHVYLMTQEEFTNYYEEKENKNGSLNEKRKN